MLEALEVLGDEVLIINELDDREFEDRYEEPETLVDVSTLEELVWFMELVVFEKLEELGGL